MRTTILVISTIWLAGCAQPVKPVATAEQQFAQELAKTLAVSHSAEMSALDRQAETLARIESEVLRLHTPAPKLIVENHDTVEQPELWIPPQEEPDPVQVSEELEQFFRAGFDELSERLQKLEIGLEQVQAAKPEPGATVQHQPVGLWTAKHFLLLKIEQPGCPPCKKWSLTEKKLVKCRVDDWDHTKKGKPVGSPKIVRCPSFQLYIHTGSAWEPVCFFDGYTSASTINTRIDKEIETRNNPQPAAEQPAPKPVVNDRNDIVCRGWSQARLREWCREHYTPQTELWADVSPRSFVWDHLVWHGLSRQQVDGLPQWEALAIHDAIHSGRLVP